LFCGANFASGSGVLWSLDVWVVLLFFWWEAGAFCPCSGVCLQVLQEFVLLLVSVFLLGAVAFVIFFSTSCALSY
jgi:hypothetical protein